MYITVVALPSSAADEKTTPSVSKGGTRGRAKRARFCRSTES
jgi:hypothetical protein